MNKIILFFGLAMLVGLVSAETVVITPHYSISGNVMSIYFTSSNVTLNSTQNLGNNGLAEIMLENIQITNITSVNSFVSNRISGILTYKTPLGAQATTVDVFNGQHNIVVNNVTIVPPPSINKTFSLSPSFSDQKSSTEFMPNVTFGYNLTRIPKFNVTNFTVLNTTPLKFEINPYSASEKGYNVTVQLPHYSSNLIYMPSNSSQANDLITNMLNISILVKPIQHENLSVNSTILKNKQYNFSKFNTTVLVNKFGGINENKTLLFGQNVSLPLYNASFRAEDFSVNDINNTILNEFYNLNVARNCLQTINVTNINGSSKYAYCNKINGSTVSIYDLCAGAMQYTNVTQGFGQCIMTLYRMDNISAEQWHQLYDTQEQQLNTTSIELASYKNGAQQAAVTQSFFASIIQDGLILVVAAIFIVIYLRRQKGAPRSAPRG